MGSVTFGTAGALAGMSSPAYDYVSRAYDAPTLTETWTFRFGGSTGRLVATITIVYDAGDNIVSVTRV
jgi:hypothetical protein